MGGINDVVCTTFLNRSPRSSFSISARISGAGKVATIIVTLYSSVRPMSA